MFKVKVEMNNKQDKAIPGLEAEFKDLHIFRDGFHIVIQANEPTRGREISIPAIGMKSITIETV